MNRNIPFLVGAKNVVRRGSRGFTIMRGSINSNEKQGVKPNVTTAEDGATPSDGCGGEPESLGQSHTEHQGLRRDMTSNQLAMIAFSGSVGTGLIIGAGANLVNGELNKIR